MKIALTSQNKYKKKILFDVIEEEEDEDKNKVNNKNQNSPKNLDINVLQSENIGNIKHKKNRTELIAQSYFFLLVTYSSSLRAWSRLPSVC